MPTDKQIGSEGQATVDDICNGALKHYERLARECHEWLSTIPHAIEIYRQYLTLSKQDGVPREKKTTRSIYSEEEQQGYLVEDYEAKGYNQARQSMLLYFIGKAGVERIEKAVDNYIFANCLKAKVKTSDLAQAISESILGGKE